MFPLKDFETLRSTDANCSSSPRSLIRIGRRMAKRCWWDHESIHRTRVFCQNSGACGSTYVVKLLNENGVPRSFHEKAPDFLQIGLNHYEQPILAKRLVRLLRYTRHDVFFEANNRLFSLTCELAVAFPNARFIHLHRDGIEVVRSAMSKPGIGDYLRRNIRFQGSLAGPHFGDPFTRFCHHWANMNRRIFDDIRALGDKPGFEPTSLRFEDLIKGRLGPLENVLDRKLDYRTGSPVNVGRLGEHGKFPRYRDWTSCQKQIFESICGPVMSLLNR